MMRQAMSSALQFWFVRILPNPDRRCKPIGQRVTDDFPPNSKNAGFSGKIGQEFGRRPSRIGSGYGTI
jgi:hypothetical protein